MANGHARRRRQKRQQILVTAMELFQIHGFKRVSVAEIAKAAGASQVTIYKYFENKKSLLRETIQVFFAAKAKQYQEILASNQPYADRLALLLADKSELFHSFAGELSQTLRQQDQAYLDEILHLRRQAIAQAFLPFLAEGRRAGLIGDDVEDMTVLAYLDIVAAGLIHSPAYKELEHHDSNAFARIQQLAVRALIGPF